VKQSRAWWQGRSKVFLDQCARLIEERIGRAALDGVFLCGSFATGEESIVLETDPPQLLSDVDLVAVGASAGEIRKWSRRRAELGAACEALFGELRFVGRVEVGIMARESLRAQPAKPGVYDMRRAGVVLAGSPTILEAIPAYRPDDIKIEEALVLLENRVIPLLCAYPDAQREYAGSPYEFFYHTARVYTDIAVAALSIAGEYAPGYAARRDRIVAGEKEGSGSALSKFMSPILVSKIDRWTRFKLDPSLETARLRPEPEALMALWNEAAGDLLAFWLFAAARRRGLDAEGRRPVPVAAVAGWSRDLGRWRDHLRGWRPILAGMGGGRSVGLAGELGARLFTASPSDIVRERGIRLLDSVLTHGPEVPVRGSRWGFPHGGGDWKTAVRQLHAAWTGIVFDRRPE